jgi:hypothetical protein
MTRILPLLTFLSLLAAAALFSGCQTGSGSFGQQTMATGDVTFTIDGVAGSRLYAIPLGFWNEMGGVEAWTTNRNLLRSDEVSSASDAGEALEVVGAGSDYKIVVLNRDGYQIATLETPANGAVYDFNLDLSDYETAPRR